MLKNRFDLSDHFCWEEVTITSHRDIYNELPEELVNNVKFTAKRMEFVRSLLNSPITVLSWYRSPQLNSAIGGSKTSDHMQGCAVDFRAYSYGDPLAVCKKLAKYANLVAFKQLIFEHTWVHISFDPTPGIVAKKEVLTLLHDKTYAVGITDKSGQVLV
jgi:hypothetical protein